MKKILFSTAITFASVLLSHSSALAQTHIFPGYLSMYGNVPTATTTQLAGDELLYRWQE